MIFKFLCNILTLTFLSYHTYNHYKIRKTTKKTKQYPYIFIVLALMFSFEQAFMFILKFLAFYYVLKFTLVCVICFPYTNIAQMLYKEYLVRIMRYCEDNCDDKISGLGYKWRVVMIEMYDKLFEAFKSKSMTNCNAKVKSIELQNIMELQDDVKTIKYEMETAHEHSE